MPFMLYEYMLLSSSNILNQTYFLFLVFKFNQTHSQALQTQMQAILTLQEQQGTILASVLPLLPLVQSIPVHLESLKTDLRTAAQAVAVSTTPKASTGLNQDQTLTLARKRTHSDVDVDANSSSPMSSLLTAKRARLEKATEAPETISAGRDSETEALHPAMSSPDKEPPKSLIVSSLLNQLQRTSTSPTGLVNTSSLGNATPRRPLADIPLAQLERPVSIAGRLSSRSNTSLSRASSPLVLGITSSATRPPRTLRVHTSTPGSAHGRNASPGSSKPNSATAAIPTLPTEKPKSSASHGNHLLTFALKTPVRAPSAAAIHPQQSTPLKSTLHHAAPEQSSSSNLTEPPQSKIPTATTASAIYPPRPRPIRKNAQAPKPDIVPNAPTLPAQEIVPFKSSPIVNRAEGQRERRSPFVSRTISSPFHTSLMSAESREAIYPSCGHGRRR